MNLKMRLSIYLLLHVFGTLILKTSIAHAYDGNSMNCSNSKHVAVAGVVEKSSRIGREQKIAMEMAIRDFCRMTSNCSCPTLHLKDSQGNLFRSVYEVIDLMDLMENKQVQAVIGSIIPQVATLVSQFDKLTKKTPSISLTPTATSSLPRLATEPSFLEMSHDVTTHMQCIASIVGHFSWRKVTPIYENHSRFSFGCTSPLIHLSDALHLVDSTIERHLIFPPLHSLSNASSFIEHELEKLKMLESRIFVILQSSISSCILLFEKAKKLGMMEKGYDQSKNKNYVTWMSIDKFEAVLEEPQYPWSYVMVPYNSTYGNLVAELLDETLDMVAGDIEIEANRYSYSHYTEPYMESETFDVVTKRFLYRDAKRYVRRMVLRSKHKPLRVGVPAEAIFNQFVKVSYDKEKNKTYVTGTSIDVLEAVSKELPYTLSYVMVPFKGTYDNLVANKNFDMAIGDIEITADRYKYSEFSQPFMETELVMVVPVKRHSVKEGFIFFYVFTIKTWMILLAMTAGTVSVVWFNEHIHGNEDFVALSTLEYITRMLWFAVAILSLSHRELIKNNLSRLVLAIWFCVNMIVAVCFAATLSSIITDSSFRPSLDLRRNNYVVGCNENSFVCRYLVDVLQYLVRIFIPLSIKL